MAERAPQILSDGITAVDGLVVRRKVHSIWSVCSRYFVQDSSIPVSAQSSPIWRIITAALLVLADLSAVRASLRSALFARFFAVVFMAGLLTKTLADVFYCREDGPPSTFNGLHLDEASIFARARCLESRKVRQGAFPFSNAAPGTLVG